MLGGNEMADQLENTGSGHLHHNLNCFAIPLKELPKGTAREYINGVHR
jgi:hypothetical protein